MYMHLSSRLITKRRAIAHAFLGTPLTCILHIFQSGKTV